MTDQMAGWTREDVEREHGELIREKQAQMRADAEAKAKQRLGGYEFRVSPRDGSDTDLVVSVTKDSWRFRVVSPD